MPASSCTLPRKRQRNIGGCSLLASTKRSKIMSILDLPSCANSNASLLFPVSDSQAAAEDTVHRAGIIVHATREEGTQRWWLLLACFKEEN